jgi:hypothetical protein
VLEGGWGRRRETCLSVSAWVWGVDDREVRDGGLGEVHFGVEVKKEGDIESN